MSFWRAIADHIICKMGGTPKDAASKPHKFIIETPYGKYHADKVKVHMNGSVEWELTDPTWGHVKYTCTSGAIEITDIWPDRNE